MKQVYDVCCGGECFQKKSKYFLHIFKSKLLFGLFATFEKRQTVI